MRRASRPSARRMTLGLGAAVTGVVLLGSPAAADVNVTPDQAVQGDAASVTFRVENQRPGAHTTKVEVLLPADLPVAEVYPMTVPDWAPQIVSRAADRPLPGIHGSGLTSATSAVIWTRASDAPAPPTVEELRLEMGPMPTAARFVFTVVQTYSDGTVQRWSGPSPASAGRPAGPGTVLSLLPAPVAQDGGASGGQQQADGHGHGQAQGGGQAASGGPAASGGQLDVQPVAAAPAPAGQDSSLDPVTVGAVGAVSLALVGALLLAVGVPARRREADATQGRASTEGSAEGSTAPEPGDDPAAADDERAPTSSSGVSASA